MQNSYEDKGTTMPTVPDKRISFFHQPHRIWDSYYSGEHPLAPILLPAGIRTEIALKTETNKIAPLRGIIKRIFFERTDGGAFDFDIVDKPFGTGVAPAEINKIYEFTAATFFKHIATIEIPYECKLSTVFPYGLYIGITPTGSAATFNAHVYVESRL